MKHTPGPWKLFKSMHAGPHGIFLSQKLGYIDVPVFGWKEDHSEEMTANAHLMTAAPDLLEALENIENDDGSIPSTIWDMRNAAIAKANGTKE